MAIDFEAVKRWDKKNPGFYDLFKGFTYEGLRAGKKQLSGWLVANRVRWDTVLKTEGSDWKVPNGCIAYYTRLFMIEHPHHAGFFETRPLKEHLTQEELEAWSRER